MSDLRFNAQGHIVPAWHDGDSAEKPYVDFSSIVNRYMNQFRASYEKSNNWPISGAIDGMCILDEEITETSEAACNLCAQWEKTEDVSLYSVGNLRGYAVSVILEALQVISVCDKYESVFENFDKPRAEREEK